MNIEQREELIELYDLYFSKISEGSPNLEHFVYTLLEQSTAKLRYDLYKTKYDWKRRVPKENVQIQKLQLSHNRWFPKKHS